MLAAFETRRFSIPWRSAGIGRCNVSVVTSKAAGGGDWYELKSLLTVGADRFWSGGIDTH